MINPFIPEMRPNGRSERAEEVTLSICMPTRNRAQALDYVLPQIRTWSEGWGFPYEIVVSDDSSTDATADVVERFRAQGMPIHYFKQVEAKGPSNPLSALHRARGKYLIALADDALLIPDAVADTIRFMQSNPDICACYAPWEIYDDVGNVNGELSHLQPDELKIFRPGDEADLIGHIVQHHIVPEVAVYRADAVRMIVSTPHLCHWAFSHLTTVSAKGPVAFQRAPCYRAMPRDPGQPGNAQAELAAAVNSWDQYRGGVEYMVFSLLRRRNISATEEMARSFRGLIDHFMEHRMRLALRAAFKAKDYITVYEIICRICHLNPSLTGTFEHSDRLPLMVMAQTLARFANSIAEVERLLVAGVDDGQVLGQLLRDVGLERRILVIPPPANPSAKNLRTSVVFIAREELRQSFLDQGYPPAMIISEGEVGASLLL
jgi:glycosyltransferase involved in cell wall biosynthesis